ncbi:unnamed protein product [Vitrella brassicaformis CCMP3155]|uniref:TLDc domain-containing protein n=1 Tax=Vitrella brassicaformis (strain CCMP3155) TaxID=1169540 RepID=A0A0G4H4U9_VITBC|nr:unnamed protein product [Vitrella brassicaformis CCMP3155]|eukprot:CEM38820.1 unnamed protein product [Vitrella brassicaformis CCMP3155]
MSRQLSVPHVVQRFFNPALSSSTTEEDDDTVTNEMVQGVLADHQDTKQQLLATQKQLIDELTRERDDWKRRCERAEAKLTEFQARCGYFGAHQDSVLTVLSARDHAQLIEWLGGDRTLVQLYKATRDGGMYGSLLDRVGGARGLLFIIRVGSLRFGAYMSGGIDVPDTNRPCDVWFFSLTGHDFSGPTKIPLRHKNNQMVSIAARDGALESRTGENKARMCIGGGGILWLGYGDNDAPAADIRRIQHWVHKDDVPAGYTGMRAAVAEISSSQCGFLGSNELFTAEELEVWHVVRLHFESE